MKLGYVVIWEVRGDMPLSHETMTLVLYRRWWRPEVEEEPGREGVGQMWQEGKLVAT